MDSVSYSFDWVMLHYFSFIISVIPLYLYRLLQSDYLLFLMCVDLELLKTIVSALHKFTIYILSSGLRSPASSFMFLLCRLPYADSVPLTCCYNCWTSLNTYCVYPKCCDTKVVALRCFILIWMVELAISVSEILFVSEFCLLLILYIFACSEYFVE